MNQTYRQRTCEERIDENLRGHAADLECLWRAYGNGQEEVTGLGSLGEYGLGFDYVAPFTFEDQKEGYFRYQLSWGGPSDEFRFFVNPDLSCHRVEYWFLDWFDGACRILSGETETLLLELWEWLRETAAENAVAAAEP